MSGPQKKQAKTPEQIAAEKAEAERIRAEITQRINTVPASVLEGSVQRARDWKEKAFKAMKLCERDRVRIDDLRNAVALLRAFG
ncbi:hypothetical protein [Burkholderia sp. B21-005]|uniref:hypothetical protein n=1 Tax=Burkholderia sp. B21-005 TaxID=2890406 RepID=UPI001E59C268|nr:hypothetical protein [Burkholderia sp. B21-005]UEP43165.1 hypothetical protein LMA02_24135 [Burkholderia sp. B21-005]